MRACGAVRDESVKRSNTLENPNVGFTVRLFRTCTVRAPLYCLEVLTRTRSDYSDRNRDEGTSHNVAGGRCWINTEGKVSYVVTYISSSLKEKERETVCICRSENWAHDDTNPTRSDPTQRNGTGSVPVPNERLPVNDGFISSGRLRPSCRCVIAEA